MNTSNPEILKQFYSVLNRKNLTKEVYNYLIKQWGLEGVDLDAEMILINQKQSKLSRSRRDAIPEFLTLKKIIEENEIQVMTSNSFSENENNDQISLDQIN